MPRSPRQKQKILYLKELLEKESDVHTPLRMEDILSYLSEQGISAERKSIYTDFEALRDMGMDIVYSKKEPRGYYLKNRPFETAELKILIDSVESSKFITQKKTYELIEKLSAFETRNQLRLLKRQVYVHERIKSMNESIYHNVDRIHEAISKDQRITFEYFSYDIKKQKILRKGGARYDVSPVVLCLSGENYYLIAYDHKAEMIKHYRVDKMLRILLSKEKRLGKEVFEKIDIASYSQKYFSMYSGEEVSVTLRFSNELAGVVIDRFGKNLSFFPAGDEHFETRIKVALSPFFFGWIAALGDKAVILRPQEAIDGMKEMIQTVNKLY